MKASSVKKTFSVMCLFSAGAVSWANDTVVTRSGIKLVFGVDQPQNPPLRSPLLAHVDVIESRHSRGRAQRHSITGQYMYANVDERAPFYVTLAEDGETAYMVGLGYNDAHPYYVTVKVLNRRNVQISNPMALGGEPGRLSQIRAVAVGSSPDRNRVDERGLIISAIANIRDRFGEKEKIYFRTGFYHAYNLAPNMNGWSRRLPDWAESLIDRAERDEGLRGRRDLAYDDLLRDQRDDDRDDRDGRAGRDGDRDRDGGRDRDGNGGRGRDGDRDSGRSDSGRGGRNRP
jgi:hypothetical protein